LAVLGNNTQTRGSSCLSQEETCHIEFSSYQYLGNKRIYSISDNVQEFTRDSLQRNDLPSTNKILFGFSYNSTDDRTSGLNSITKPIYYAHTSSEDIGFRLIRYKKHSDPKTSKLYNLTWEEKSIVQNKNYIWDHLDQIYIHKAELLDWMLKHKDRYSEQTQHTINVLLEQGSAEDLKKMSGLYLDEKNISDLTPLAGLTNLQYINISYNLISDLAPLAGLTKLRSLILNNNNISDLTPLASLINLKKLNLLKNNISDITHLASLKYLNKLELYQNNISDLTPLSGLTDLEDLNLSDNRISDPTSLAGLTKLEHLYLDNNNISDLTPLAGLTNVRELVLYSNHISDLTPLASMINLEGLWVYYNNISNITPLANLTKLQVLCIMRNPIADYSPLKELEKNGCHIEK
jgi:internalin A